MSNLSLRHLVTPAAAAALVLVIGATPASARPDAGLDDTAAVAAAAPATTSTAGASDCRLERIGRQLVRCDSLTGSGVAAPAWVASQSVAAATGTSASATTGSAENATASLADEDLLTKFRRHGI